jgi:tRNA (cmo5U34)-methyltransferase
MQLVASTRAVFERTASTYDADRARLIPCYERLYGCAVELIPAGADHILDLGAGTGLLSAFVRARFPEAYLHLMDNAEAMLARARERFSGDPEVVFEVADYSQGIEQRGYDAIVSALSIHHLENGAKRDLFGSILAALRPGGVFVNAEQVAGPTPELEARYKAQWLEQVRAAGATPQQIADSLLRQQEDRCASVEDQLLWMRTAGFAEVDCWFKDGRFALLAGTKKE